MATQEELDKELTDRAATDNFRRYMAAQKDNVDADMTLSLGGDPPVKSTESGTVDNDKGFDSLLGGPTAAYRAEPEPTVLDDIAAIPKQSVAGGIDAFVEQGRAVRDVAEWAGRHVDADAVDAISDWADTKPNFPSMDRVGPISGFFRSFFQFLVGMAGPAKVLKFSKWGAGIASTAGKGIVGGGLSGATAFDPDDPNVGEVIGDFASQFEPMRDLFDTFPEPVQNFLLNLPDQPNDSALQKRWKAFQADGLAVGVPVEIGMAAMRVFKAGKALTKMAKENMDYDIESDVVREIIRKDAPESIIDTGDLAKERGAIRTSRNKIAEIEGKITKELETVKDIPDLQDTPKTLKVRPKLKKAKDQLKKQEDKLAAVYRDRMKHGKNPRTGLPNGATRFVDPVIGADGKVIDFESLGISWENVDTVHGLLMEIRTIVARLETEIIAGSKMGPTERKRRAKAALEKFEKELEGDPIKYFNVWSGTKENRALSNLTHRPFTFRLKTTAYKPERRKGTDRRDAESQSSGGSEVDSRASVSKDFDSAYVERRKGGEVDHDYQSVEHAYQSLKSGSFDEVAYNKKWDSGVKIRGTKGTKTKDNWNVTLMKDLMRSSFGSVDKETGKFVFNVEADWALRELKKSKGKTITHEGGKKDVWTDEFPRILSELRDEFFGPTFLRTSEEIIVDGIGYGARTESQAMAMEVVRTAAGSRLWNLMTAAMKGSADAIAELPIQLARTTYIEGLLEKSSFVFDQRKSIQEITRQLEHSKLGFGRNFNAEAAALMQRMRQTIPDADGVDLAVRLNSLTGRNQYSNLLHQGAKPGMFQYFLEHYYNSILSGVDSMMGNGFGAHAYLVYQMPTRFVAAAVGGGRSLYNGPPKLGEPMTQASFSALLAGTQAYVRTFADSLFPLANNMARNIFLKDPETTFTRQKFEDFQQKAINAETASPVIGAIDKMFRFATQDTLSIRTPLEMMANAHGKIMRTVQNTYSIADEFNKNIAKHFELNYMAQIAQEGAFRELDAAIRAGKIKNWDNKATAAFYEASLKRLNEGHETIAEEFADMIAFTQEMKHTAPFKTFVDEFPAFRVLFPLLRSQASIIENMLTNSPLAPITPYFREQVAKGGVHADIARTKMYMGYMVGLTLWGAWQGGRVTGSAPSDKKTRKNMEQLGFQPNSFLLDGDAWYFGLDKILNKPRAMAGRVIEVDDADTVTIQDSNGDKHIVRFLGVDADEKDMDLGPSSTWQLKEMIMGKDVTVEWREKGHFGRVLGTVIHDGKNINKAIIEESAGVREKGNPPRYGSFKDLGPFGPLMKTWVNTFETVADPPNEALKGIEIPDDRNILAAMAEDIRSNLTNQTYYNGVFQIINGINTGGDQWLVNLSKSMVPRILSKSADVAAGVKRDFSMFDPTTTENHKLLQKMLIPWKSLDPRYGVNNPKRDGNGRMGVRPPTTLGSYFNFPSVSMQAVRNDAIVYMHFLNNQFYFPDMPSHISVPNPFGDIPFRADLTVEERIRFGELMEKATFKGKSYFSGMRDLVTSSAFLKLNFGPKSEQYKRLKMLRDSYLQTATKDLVEERPYLRARIESEARATIQEQMVDNVPNPHTDLSTRMMLEKGIPKQ